MAAATFIALQALTIVTGAKQQAGRRSRL
jgi:hypothetical protein